MPRLWVLGAAVGLSAVLIGGEAGAQRPPHEAILPLGEYRAADARALAESHRAELQGLYDDVRRCAPEVDFNKPGIGFRRPQDVPDASPHLALWVWVDTPEQGVDTGGRAAAAFWFHARKLLGRLMGRAPIHADARVGGYILVLTWVGPAETGGRAITETLVVRAAKPAAAAFVAGSLPAPEFLRGAVLRLFDGETELSSPIRSFEGREAGEPDVPSPPC